MPILIVAATCVACGGSSGPSGSCRSDSGLVLCVERGEYRPGASARVEIRNASSEILYVDTCSTFAASRETLEVFGAEYRPDRRCAADATLPEILSRAFELAPGESAFDDVTIGAGSPQGFYRVLYWLLDVTGTLVSPDAATTPEFDVFPSAG
ncbi:MAG: hypothetical protein R3195_01565 [Gemmatimonadota bacterium]|nr:hypothetical protein [Gemmatimonadota bacterium]